MKKKDLISLLNVLSQLSQCQGNIKFSYALAKINQQIDPEISILKNIELSNKEIIKEYINQINKICSENNCIYENTSWKFPEDKTVQKEITNQIKELDEQYKDSLSQYNNKQNEYLKFLEEDISINLYKIQDITIIPNTVTPEQLGVLMLCGIID